MSLEIQGGHVAEFSIIVDPTTGNIASVDSTGKLQTSGAGGGGGSATGSAVPATANYDAINVGGILRGITGVNPSGSIYAPQIDIASWAGSTISGVNGLPVNIVAGGGTGGGPADVAATTSASESDAARQKTFTALRLYDTTQVAGSQLVTAKGDQTSGLWVNVKASTAITANQGGAPWLENITQLAGTALGAPSAYGTSPGAVNVAGVNAFVTNNVAVTTQQSNNTADYDTGVGVQTMTMFGMALPASGGAVAGGTATNPIRVDPTGTTIQPVSGTVTANAGTGTFSVSGTVTSNQGTANTLANKWPVQITDGTNTMPTGDAAARTIHTTIDNASIAVTGTFWQNTQPVSGTVTANQGGAPWSENITQFGGNPVVTGTGASGVGIPRVTVSNDSNILATQSGTWNIGTLTSITNTVNVDPVDRAARLLGHVTVDSAPTTAVTQSGNWTDTVIGATADNVNIPSTTLPVLVSGADNTNINRAILTDAQGTLFVLHRFEVFDEMLAELRRATFGLSLLVGEDLFDFEI